MVDARTYAIIVNFESAKMVRDCVVSLANEPLEAIVIVNNSPTDSQKELLKKIQLIDSRVSVVTAPRNVGFGAGVNLGVERLTLHGKDRIWLVNPDVVVTEPNTVKRLTDVLDEGFGIVSPAITTDTGYGTRVWFGGGTWDAARGVTEHWGYHAPLDTLADRPDPEPVTFITGAAMMLRASVWAQLGGFRSDLFLYWEDSDLCIRAAAARVKLAVVPSVTVWHKVGATSAEAGKSALYYRYMARNRLIIAGAYTRKRHLLFGTGRAWTVRFFGLAMKSDVHPFAKFIAALRGTVAGVLHRA